MCWWSWVSWSSIKHLLTAPYSTTTGKIEQLHKTIRAEFFTRADGMFATVAEFQQALDAWGARMQHDPAAPAMRRPAAW